MVLPVKPAIAAPRAVAARTAATVIVIGRNCAPATGSNSNGKALHDACLTGSLAWIHAIVDGEVAANHVSPGGCSILGQFVRLVLNVSRVLPVVDPDCASIAVTGSICLEERFGPMTALAKP